jgi:hypothetical protein
MPPDGNDLPREGDLRQTGRNNAGARSGGPEEAFINT